MAARSAVRRYNTKAVMTNGRSIEGAFTMEEYTEAMVFELIFRTAGVDS
jgi:hypothetical protein